MRRQTIGASSACSYNAAYGGERVIAYLFLPKNARPPYQTVVYFRTPGDSLWTRSSRPRWPTWAFS